MALLLLLAAVRTPVVASVPDVSAPSPKDTVTYHQQARAAVEQVLADREFGGEGGADSLWRRIGDWLGSARESIGSALARIPAWVGWVVVVWLLLTLLGILIHLGYVVVGLIGPGAARQSAARVGAGGPALYGIRELDFDRVRGRAADLLAAHEWSEAAKYLYVAAILWLDRAGLIAFRRSKTNYDLVREVAGRPRCHGPFVRLTTCFEATTYGGRPADQNQCQAMTADLEALQGADGSPTD